MLDGQMRLGFRLGRRSARVVHETRHALIRAMGTEPALVKACESAADAAEKLDAVLQSMTDNPDPYTYPNPTGDTQ